MRKHNYVRIYIQAHHIASFSQNFLHDTYAPLNQVLAATLHYFDVGN